MELDSKGPKDGISSNDIEKYADDGKEKYNEIMDFFDNKNNNPDPSVYWPVAYIMTMVKFGTEEEVETLCMALVEKSRLRVRYVKKVPYFCMTERKKKAHMPIIRHR